MIGISEAELLARAFESRLSDVYTSIVGRVEVFDPVKRTADVAPMVRRPVPLASGEVAYEDLPIVPSVLLLYPSAGALSITWPLVPGDFVVLLVTTHAIGQWRQAATLSNPGDLRQHHLGSCLALPLLGNPLTAAAVDPDGLVLEAPAIKLGAGATESGVKGEALKAWLEAIMAATAGGDPLVVPPVPAPYDSLDSILSTKVKIGD
jgi:hypothetical protein